MDYAREYSRLHGNLKHYAGTSIRPRVNRIAELVQEFKPSRMLDYGCGKGYQYLSLRVHERWGGLLPHCYDIGVRQLSAKPEGKFQGIICTDVMEHIEPEDVRTVLADIFSSADTQCFVMFGISCIPAKDKVLSDGRNVHVCLRPPEWWAKELDRFSRPGLKIEADYETG